MFDEEQKPPPDEEPSPVITTKDDDKENKGEERVKKASSKKGTMPEYPPEPPDDDDVDNVGDEQSANISSSRGGSARGKAGSKGRPRGSGGGGKKSSNSRKTKKAGATPDASPARISSIKPYLPNIVSEDALQSSSHRPSVLPSATFRYGTSLYMFNGWTQNFKLNLVAKNSRGKTSTASAPNAPSAPKRHADRAKRYLANELRDWVICVCAAPQDWHRFMLQCASCKVPKRVVLYSSDCIHQTYFVH